MQRHLLLGLAGLPALLSAQRVSVTCSFSTVAANGETCDSMAATWGLDAATFQSLNPKAKCPEVIGGEQYCVVGTVTTVTGEPTTAPATTSTQTTTCGRMGGSSRLCICAAQRARMTVLTRALASTILSRLGVFAKSPMCSDIVLGNRANPIGGKDDSDRVKPSRNLQQ